MPPTCSSLCVSVVFVEELRAGDTRGGHGLSAVPTAPGTPARLAPKPALKGCFVSASPVSSCVTPLSLPGGLCSPWAGGAVPPQVSLSPDPTPWDIPTSHPPTG